MNLRTRMKSGRRPDHPKLWRWIVGTLFILVAWQGLGLVLTVGAARYFDYDLQLLFSTDDVDIAKIRASTMEYCGYRSHLLYSTLYRYLARVSPLLKRNVKGLFTSFEKYSWKRTWIGFATLALISMTFGFGDIILNRDSYTWAWDASEFFPYLIIGLTLLPIQTTAEELFFRGWLQQWLDNGKKKQWTISLLSGCFLLSPYGQPRSCRQRSSPAHY